MKKIFILVILFYGGMSLKSQDRFEDGMYCSPIIGIEGIRYKFYADTFETYKACDLGCLTTKGIYKIVGNKINFYPLDPELFKKSIVMYRKGQENINIPYVKPYNEFEFHVNFKDNQGQKNNYTIWLRDSLDKAIMTFHCNGDTFNICNFNVPFLDKIKISGCDGNSEELTLKYDKKFIGEHIFDIQIANDDKHYIKDDTFSINLVNRSKNGFSIIYFGDTLELRNEKNIDNEFLNSRFNKLDTDDSYNGKSDFDMRMEEEFKREKEEYEKKK
jgi:hypothetical protein